MEDFAEVCPGVYMVPDGFCVCPGCGCPAVDLDPDKPSDVRDWAVATFRVLRDYGCEWATQEAAESLADAYNKEPWHGGEDERWTLAD